MQPNKAVFVVDDDPSIRKAMQRVLEKHGFQARLFDSAKALRLHDNFENAFCLVLDIDLGDESGIALHQELSGAGVRLPVIYMSGNASAAFRASALASGCVAYLTKPFAAKCLIEPIERLSASLA